MSMSRQAPPSPTVRVLAIVFTIVAIAGLGFASYSKRWLYSPPTIGFAQEVTFGPRGVVACEVKFSFDGEGREMVCTDMSNAELLVDWETKLEKIEREAKENPKDPMLQALALKAAEHYRTVGSFPMFGWIALVGCALATVSLLVALVFLLLKKRPALPIMPTTTGLLGIVTALFAGCIYVATKPGAAIYVGMSNGFIAYGAGIVAGLVGALMINKLQRPVDESGGYWDPH
jgi:hypothetical protein